MNKITKQALKLVFHQTFEGIRHLETGTAPSSEPTPDEQISRVDHPLKKPSEMEQGKLEGKGPTISLPTSEQTKQELKRRLGKELYKAELDLSAKLRIAGHPCDCLDQKHTLGMEATSEELIPIEPDNPVYSQIITWIRENQSKVTPEAVATGRYDEEYPRMAAEFRNFRKEVMGTAKIGALVGPEERLTLDQAKRLAAEEAAKRVQETWEKET